MKRSCKKIKAEYEISLTILKSVVAELVANEPGQVPKHLVGGMEIATKQSKALLAEIERCGCSRKRRV